MLGIASDHTGKHGNRQVMAPSNFIQECHVAGQGAARKRGARRNIGFHTDPRIAAYGAFHVRCLGPHLFAHRGDLIYEHHARRQESIERVLGHLGRFNAHPQKIVADAGKDRLQQCACLSGARTNDDPSRIFENLDRLAQAKILGRTGKVDLATAEFGTEMPFQFRNAADRHLGGHNYDCAVAQIRKQGADLGLHISNIGAVIIINGRVEGDPNNLRVTHRHCRVCGEGEGARGYTFLDRAGQTRLEERRHTIGQVGDGGGVGIET